MAEAKGARKILCCRASPLQLMAPEEVTDAGDSSGQCGRASAGGREVDGVVAAAALGRDERDRVSARRREREGNEGEASWGEGRPSPYPPSHLPRRDGESWAARRAAATAASTRGRERVEDAVEMGWAGWASGER